MALRPKVTILWGTTRFKVGPSSAAPADGVSRASPGLARSCEPKEEAVALDLHDLAPRPRDEGVGARDRLVEDHQEMQEDVARRARSEVRRVGEDDRAVLEQGGKARAVEGRAVFGLRPPAPLEERAEAACPHPRPAEHARGAGGGWAPPAHGWNSIFVTCWLGSGEHSASAE
jgi:hypothetical protein